MDVRPLDKELRARAREHWTGCLRVSDRHNDANAELFIFDGEIYSVQIIDHEPNLLARIAASGMVDDDRRRLFESQSPPEDWNATVGRFAVEHGWLSVERLAEFHSEYLLAALTGVRAVAKPRVASAEGAVTKRLCALPSDIDEVLASVDIRTSRSRDVWSTISPATSPRVTVLRLLGSTAAASYAAPEVGAFAELVDAQLSVGEVASICGFTQAEAEFLAVALVNEGHAEVMGTKAVTNGTHLVPEDFSAAVSGRRP